jgi:membrane protein implicated in regulation of membrane protease activity
MTWSDFYLLCFLVGFLLTLLSFAFGHLHVHFHHGGPHVHVGGHAHHGGHAGGGNNLPFFNFGTSAAFLAWFGGSGFLFSRYTTLWIWWGLSLAMGMGLVGASLVFWFVSKVLMKNEKDLNPADYEMVGVLGKLSANIRPGGTGEMIYSQEGSRRVVGARSDDGSPIPKGTEVVITRYEKGIAYVRRWEEFSGMHE